MTSPTPSHTLPLLATIHITTELDGYHSDDSLGAENPDRVARRKARADRARARAEAESPQAHAARFEARLHQQLEYTTEFYHRKLADAQRSAHHLRKLVGDATPSVSGLTVEGSPRADPTPTAPGTMADIALPPQPELAAPPLDGEPITVEDGGSGQTRQPQGRPTRPTGAMERVVAGNTLGATAASELSPMPSAKTRQVEAESNATVQELQRTWQNLEDLQEFARLNVTAVRKVVKKYIKARTDEFLKTDWPELIAAHPMSDPKPIEHCMGTLASARSGLAARSREELQRVATAASHAKFEPVLVPQPVAVVARLDLESLPAGRVSLLRLALAVSALSEPVSVPIMVARGVLPGPTVGLTAAIHGNEIAGIPLIHQLMRELDPSNLCGNVVAIPVVNPPGFRRFQRGFSDGVDLNRIMPGKKRGAGSQAWAAALVKHVLPHLDVLLDLHTASFGRENSLYVRADMTVPEVARLARALQPEIVVHNTGVDGSWRGTAGNAGITALTIEMGNPQVLNAEFVKRTYAGVSACLVALGMSTPLCPPMEFPPPVMCVRSFWIYTRTGGVLYVLPNVGDWVRRGETIAEVCNIFGQMVDRYFAPESGIVVGRSNNLVADTGARVLHLGVPGDTFTEGKMDDGHM